MRHSKIPDDTQQVLTTISRFIREYRLQSGYTQQELAEMSGIHYNTIHRLESGHAHNIKSVIEICLSLQLPLRELFWEL
jgi:DNA-binding XRE family transcriptional regulator